MKLDFLCGFDFAYDEWEHVQPYGDLAGPAWGRGTGTFTGDRLSGQSRWSNHATMRSDGLTMPNFRGVIMTSDGGEVLFDLVGRTSWSTQDGQRVGRQLMMMLLESDHEQHRWLNDAVCIGEGIFEPQTGTGRVEVFHCVHESG